MRLSGDSAIAIDVPSRTVTSRTPARRILSSSQSEDARSGERSGGNSQIEAAADRMWTHEASVRRPFDEEGASLHHNPAGWIDAPATTPRQKKDL